MIGTATELRGLLASCLKWRDGLPWVDRDALLVLADWCEENGRTEEPARIRRPVKLTRTEAMSQTADRAYSVAGTGFARFGEFCIHVRLNPGGGNARAHAVPSPMPDHSPVEYVLGLLRSVDMHREHTDYFTNKAEHTPPRGVTRAALRRITDLARWDLICHMLGYPPMRLIAEE